MTTAESPKTSRISSFFNIAEGTQTIHSNESISLGQQQLTCTNMDYHRYFERLIGKRISGRSFRRYKALLKAHKLPINKPNLETLAKLKLAADSRNQPLALILEFFLKASTIEGSITGKQLYEYLRHITSGKPHRTTITRWFGEYIPDKIYSAPEASKIIINAFIYNLRNQSNGTQQKSTRSNQISAKEAWRKCG